MIDATLKYESEMVTPPGDTLLELLEERGITQSELARRMGRPPKTISQIVNGKGAITSQTALELERVLGTPATYWLTHEANYQSYLNQLRYEESMEEWVDWLDRFPVAELKRLDVLPELYNRGRNKRILLRSLLDFFGVNSPIEWKAVYGNLQPAFRQSMPEKCDPYATAAWLRLGELMAQETDVEKYNSNVFVRNLEKCRELTILPQKLSYPQLVRLCADAGVVLAHVPAIPRVRVSGAARWLNGRPIIQLSLYGKQNDRYWFTFFHESGHLLHHSNKLVYLDDWRSSDRSAEEQQADDFARHALIPSRYEDQLLQLTTEAEIVEFAAKTGVHPGIVVGRLQHDGVITYREYNYLKESAIEL